MVVLLGRRSKVLPAIGGPCRGRRIPRGADAPLGTYARTAPPEASRFLLPPARRCRSSPPRTARCAVLLLLAAGRGSEQGRRWAAPVVLRSLAARSASASGWAALGGHAGLNGPREERRASALLPFSERSPTSRRSAALFPPAFGGLRVGARAKRRNAVAAEAVSLHSVLRTDAAAQERSALRSSLRAQPAFSERKRWLLRRAACAPERRASRGAYHPVRISSAGFSGSVHSTKRRDAFSFVHLHRRNTITSNAAPRSRRAIRPACLSTPNHRGHLPTAGGKRPAGRIKQGNAPVTVAAAAFGLVLTGGRASPSADWFSNLRITSINQTPFPIASPASPLRG